MEKGEAVFPKRMAVSDEDLPKARLALMNPQGNSFTQRRTEVLGGEVLFIERVPSFMQNGKEVGREVFRVDPGGEPKVMRGEREAKGMRRESDARGVAFKPHRLEKHLPHLQLSFGLVLLMKKLGRRLPAP